MTRLAAGLCSVTFRALAPDAVIALAAEAGIGGIEWGSDRHVPPGDGALAAAVARRCRDAGIAVASYGSYVEAGGNAGQPFPAVLEAARALGAPNIRVWAGRRGTGSAEATPADRAAAAEALRGMAEAAAGASISIGLEFHPNTLTDTLDSTLDLLAAAAHPNLFTYWQPRPGIALDESLAQLDAVARHLSHLHVFSWTAERERLPLADHATAWQPILARAAALPGVRPGPRYAMLEFVAGDDPDAFRRDARTLAEWIAVASSAQGSETE